LLIWTATVTRINVRGVIYYIAAKIAVYVRQDMKLRRLVGRFVIRTAQKVTEE